MKAASLDEINKEQNPDLLFDIHVRRILRDADRIENALRGPIPAVSPIHSFNLKTSAKVLREAADKLDEIRGEHAD